MSFTRRRMMLGTMAVATTVLGSRLHGGSRSKGTEPDMAPDTFARETLILHDGSATSCAFTRQACRAAAGARIFERRVTLLTLTGFAEAGELIKNAGGRRLLALLDDADSVVLETLLKMRGAASFDRRRYGRRVLLSARLA